MNLTPLPDRHHRLLWQLPVAALFVGGVVLVPFLLTPGSVTPKVSTAVAPDGALGAPGDVSRRVVERKAPGDDQTERPDLGDDGDSPAKPENDELKRKIDKALNDKKVRGATTSIHVVDLATGATLYRKNGDKKLNPASNMKVITAAAVLDRFGPAHTFKTELRGPGVRKGTVAGDVELRGDGDPFLLWGHLVEMAARAKRKGIDVIDGDIVVNDSAFDDQFLPPQFDQKNEDATYRATISAVAAEFSAVTLVIRPGKVGKPPIISFEPPNDYIVVDNRATTVKSSGGNKGKGIQCESIAENDGTRFIIRGKVAVDGGASVRKRIHNPSLYTGHLMKAALEMVQIEVKGGVRRGKADKASNVYARHNSYTLPYNVMAMQKWSNNFMAEMLFKSLDLGDDPATFAGAQEKIAEFLEKAGLDRGSYRITNGSGLYDANEISAEQLTTVLGYMQTRRDILPEFEASFAIAGTDGTLRKRMTKSPADTILRGKTGTLNRVSTLTGYVQRSNGTKVGYSLLFNDAKGGVWAARKAQDEIGAALADYAK